MLHQRFRYGYGLEKMRKITRVSLGVFYSPEPFCVIPMLNALREMPGGWDSAGAIVGTHPHRCA